MLNPINKSAKEEFNTDLDPMCDICWFCDADGVNNDYRLHCDALDYCVFSDT